MAFDLVQAGGYGYGELGDVTDPNVSGTGAGCICTTGILESADLDGTLEVSVDSAGLVDFDEGVEVLFYIAGNSGSTYDQRGAEDIYGLWAVATITEIERYTTSGFNFVRISVTTPTGKFNPMTINPGESECTIFVITIPHFRNLTLNAGYNLIPPHTRGEYSGNLPLVFKCSGTLTLNGGHIDLRNRGAADKGWTAHFSLDDSATLDTDKYSGWENSDTKDRLPLNAKDGAAFIIAKKIVVADSSSRIGNPNTSGAQFYRGATDSRVYDGTKPRLGCRSGTRTQIGTSFLILQI